MRLTNLQLLNAALFVVVMIGLLAIANTYDASRGLLFFFVSLIPLTVLAIIVYGYVWKQFEKGSVWLQPVSARTGKIVINSVVSAWLFLVGLLLFLMLSVVVEKGSPLIVTMTTLVTIVALLGAVGLGKYLSKRFRSESLLMYGISFFLALLFVLGAFVVGAPRK